MSDRRPGQVIGRAGGTLEDGHNDWAANADVARQGHRGEVRTAEVLNPLALAPGGPTVLHDLVVPGSRANIDHAIVSGRDVTLIDSKQWKPGFYWTVAGHTFRGMSRFAYADKATMAMACDKVRAHLEARGVRARVRRPVIVVWSSSRQATPSVTLLRIAGARVVAAGAISFVAARGSTADPAVVAALMELLPGRARRQPAGAGRGRATRGSGSTW